MERQLGEGGMAPVYLADGALQSGRPSDGFGCVRLAHELPQNIDRSRLLSRGGCPPAGTDEPVAWGGFLAHRPTLGHG